MASGTGSFCTECKGRPFSFDQQKEFLTTSGICPAQRSSRPYPSIGICILRVLNTHHSEAAVLETTERSLSRSSSSTQATERQRPWI
jgi:hypothetical protein